MNITIVGKNIEVSEYLHTLVEKKVGKLERYLKPGTDMQITMSVEKNRHICEVTIPFDGVVVRAEEITGDMYASIDNVLDKLEKQISRHRTRLEKKLRDDAFAAADAPVYEQPVARKIVRTKRFSIKPMSVEEAVLQMELLGHSFYVFMNAQTDELNVLYVRKDGNLGLIESSFDEEDD